MQITNTFQLKKFDTSKIKLAIVRACFNNEITNSLLEICLQAAADHGISRDNILIYEVPGCVEIPVILSSLAQQKPEINGFVALGCVIKGETPHFDYVCKMASEGILRVSLDHNIPIGFGIITVNTLEQALARLDSGRDSLLACLQSIKVIQTISNL